MNKTLTELGDEIRAALAPDPETGVIDPDDLERLKALEQLRDDKGLRAHKALAHLEGHINALGEEIKRLTAHKRALQHNKEHLLEYVGLEMRKQEIKSLGVPGHRFTRVPNPPKTPKKERATCKDCGKWAMNEFYRVTGSSDLVCLSCAHARIQAILDEPITEHIRWK